MPRTLRIDIAYDGTDFAGWQRQSNGIAVQELIENALSAACGTERIVVDGASRTDAGVHARRQVASATLETRLDDETLCAAMNARLPDSVRVRAVQTVADGFHARFWSTGKRYIYRLECSAIRDPFDLRYAAWLRRPLDVDAMRSAARHLRGRHDFAAFATSGSPRATTVRTIRHIHILRRGNKYLLGFQGDAFLYNQVRAMVGTLLLVGQHRLSPHDVVRILKSKDRRLAGPTAPAQGLILARVLVGDRPSSRRGKSEEDVGDE